MNEAVIVLGMHRSGTSCLTGCLRSYGLYLGDVLDYSQYNLKGNQENKKVFRLNEALLNYNNGAWHTPPSQTLHWDQSLEDQRDQVLSDYLTADKLWGIKDPRMLLAYPFWKDHLPNHSFVGTIRHPKAVAQSLAARNNLSLELEVGYKIWQIYNEQLIKFYETYKFPIINFDLPDEQYKTKIHLIAQKLNLKSDTDDIFFDTKLRNQIAYTKEDCPDHLLGTYNRLLEIVI